MGEPDICNRYSESPWLDRRRLSRPVPGPHLDRHLYADGDTPDVVLSSSSSVSMPAGYAPLKLPDNALCFIDYRDLTRATRSCWTGRLQSSGMTRNVAMTSFQLRNPRM